MKSIIGTCAAAAMLVSGVFTSAGFSAQEKVFPSYEKLQQGPWQARGWSGRDFAFVQYPWTKSPLADPAASRIAHECEAQKLLTPIWKDSKYVYPLEIGEWDWGLHCFAAGHADIRKWLQGQDRRAAYFWLQTYYRIRLGEEKRHRPDKPVLSFPGHYNLIHYGAMNGANILGYEIGENIIGTQSKLAFLRGAARQFGLPTFIDVSQWYANYGHWARGEAGDASSVPVYLAGLDETASPTPELVATVRKKGGSGYPNGGHSASWMARAWYLAWLSGVNVVVPEAAQAYFFVYNPKDPNQREVLSPAGLRAQKFLEVTEKHPDRGIPYTPIAVMLDQYCGFNGSQVGDDYAFKGEAELTCPPRPFGVLKPTFGDREIYLFLDTVWPGSMYLDMLIGRTHDQIDEHRRLVASPYGDSLDVILSNASPEVMASYPVIICLGDQEFTPDTVSRLTKYLQGGGRLLLTHAQAAKLGSALDGLKSAGRIEFFGLRPDEIPADLDVTRWYQPFLPKASEEEIKCRAEGLKLTSYEKKFTSEVDRVMGALCQEHLPVKVTGKVEYLVNRTHDGWVVGLINNEGVTKDVFGPVKVDPTKAQSVTVAMNSGKIRSATEWCTESKLDVANGNAVMLEVPPGEVRIVEMIDK